MSRKESLARRAFAAGAEGRQMAIAIESFPVNEPYTAAKKLSRMLDGGEGGDLSPTWTVLDEILAQDAETVLRILSEAHGFEEPRRRALDVPTSIREMTEALDKFESRLARLRREHRQLAKVERTGAAPRAGKGAA